MSLEILPIHKYPEYLIDCCKIINEEWKRSETARLHSLQQSSDKLPTSLVLLKNKAVIGHLKLSVIPSIKTACFVESVVIGKNLRGKGYGSILMREAENFCRDLGLVTIYLSTKGQELFYSKLGYIECTPVSIYGSFVPTNTGADITTNSIVTVPTLEEYNSTNEPTNSLPPPPPPPIPQSTQLKQTERTFMRKML